MHLSCHCYELHSPALLGARAQSTVRVGALLRAEDNGAVGYADIHPWTELGDLPLRTQLEKLRCREQTSLTRASLAFARLDREARAANRSLWDGLVVPPSHFLLPGTSESGLRTMEEALAEGFTHFKVKVGKDLAAEQKFLMDLGAELGRVRLANGTAPRLRLDYNETLMPAEAAKYLMSLGSLRQVMDFIEDPCPFDMSHWAELSVQSGFCFAVDRAAVGGVAPEFDGVIVHKPAQAGPNLPLLSKSRLVVTSYLDHPVGQLGAAWVAARLSPSMAGETHGLVSHRAYAQNEFSECLGWHGPEMQVPEGHGFGFDDALRSLPWKALP